MTNYMMRFYYTLSEADVKEDTLLGLTDSEPDDIKLVDLVFEKYSDDWIVYEDVSYNSWEEPERPLTVNTGKWQSKFKYIYDATKDRYKTLLTSYNIKKGELLNKVESVSTTKFNDTPQDGGDFSANEYTTNISSTSTAVDLTDAMTRLDIIYKGYRNVLQDWVDEFRSIFN